MTQKPVPGNNPFQSGTGSQRSTPGSLLSRSRTSSSQTGGAPSGGRAGASSSRLPPPPRFGPAQTNWEVLPLSSTYARFSLEGIGGSLQRLLGGDSATGTYESALRTLENDREALNKLTGTLNEAWAGYGLMGAMLVYTADDEHNQIIATALKATDTKLVYLRALDPLLVLNVLARARANLLQPRAPLSFDDSQLSRALLTDDPRLIRLVQDTGYIEEAIPYHPSEMTEENES